MIAAMRWIAVAALVFCSSAQGATVISPESGTSRPYQRWVNRARVPTPPIAVTVIGEPCPTGLGRSCTSPDGPIYIAPSELHPRHAFYHELGHKFDYTVMTDDGRAAFEALQGDARPWRSSPNSPHEQFAEGYSICAAQKVPHLPGYVAYGYWRGLREHRAVCRLIRAVQQDH